MKNLIWLVVLGLIVGLLTGTSAFAKDSASLSVSFVIPAVAGLNAPMTAETIAAAREELIEDPVTSELETMELQREVLGEMVICSYCAK